MGYVSAHRLPTSDTVKYLGLRLESDGGWAAQQAAGAVNGWAALHQWLPVLRTRYLTAATQLCWSRDLSWEA